MQYRIEQDTLGEVKVEADKYWGAQTQRSLENFPIGPQASMPKAIIHAFALLKKSRSPDQCRAWATAQGQGCAHRQSLR